MLEQLSALYDEYLLCNLWMVSMKKQLELYKSFVDGLVERKESITARRVLSEGLPNTADNAQDNQVLSTMSKEQRELVAKLLTQERISGMHDTLSYINELMDLEDLKLIQYGEALDNNNFESLHYDFMCRLEGDEWPE